MTIHQERSTDVGIDIPTSGTEATLKCEDVLPQDGGPSIVGTEGSSTVTMEEDEPPPAEKPGADSNVVDWDGPNDPENPHNWSDNRKWIAITVVSCFTFMSPMASSMMAPALPDVSQEFNLPTGTVIESLTLSIFVLAYAVGPLFFGPLSELYGRSIVLQISNLIFLVFNIACSRAKTFSQMLAFRFLAGIGGSGPLAVGGGTIRDLFSAENRGKALAVYTLAPLTGPALGPVMGGWIAQNTSWRWIFYATSIAGGAIQLLGLVYLGETYAPLLLERKAERLRKATGNPDLRSKFSQTDTKGYKAYMKVLVRGLVRPMGLLVSQPIMQVFALYMAILYGIMYLTLTTYARLWVESYGQSVGIAGLHYLSLGLGFTLGAQIGARLLDIIYRNLKAKNGGVGTPEMRMPLLAITSLALPIGLVIYGWSAQYRMFWLVPDLGGLIFSFGIVGSFFGIHSYLIDHYGIYTASAIAAVSSFRSLAGFGFPLFANSMFSKLGLGWGNSLLALMVLVVGCPSPWIFYTYGARLRQWSGKPNFEGGN